MVVETNPHRWHDLCETFTGRSKTRNESGIGGSFLELRGLQSRGEQAKLDDCIQKKIQSADINEPLEEVLLRLQNCNCALLSVTEAGHLLGIINLDNIMELIKILRILQEHNGQTKFKA